MIKLQTTEITQKELFLFAAAISELRLMYPMFEPELVALARKLFSQDDMVEALYLTSSLIDTRRDIEPGG